MGSRGPSGSDMGLQESLRVLDPEAAFLPLHPGSGVPGGSQGWPGSHLWTEWKTKFKRS